MYLLLVEMAKILTKLFLFDQAFDNNNLTDIPLLISLAIKKTAAAS